MSWLAPHLAIQRTGHGTLRLVEDSAVKTPPPDRLSLPPFFKAPIRQANDLNLYMEEKKKQTRIDMEEEARCSD
jgi:hypothetical protein